MNAGKTLLMLAVLAAPALAEEPALGPLIEGYGPTYLVANRDVALPEGFEYRVVLDAASGPADPSALDSTLVSAARFLNMHARNGVLADRIKLAVVVHGGALHSVLGNASYLERHLVPNPNSELLGRLRAAGVRIYVCGQSMAFNGIDKAELSEHAEVALSAMTMMVLLQSRGYAVIP